MSCPSSATPTPTPSPTSSPTSSSESDSTGTKQLILCIGFCALDIIHLCDVWPPEDIKKGSHKGYWQRGGNASNSCTVLRQLNANCEYLANMSSNPGFAVLMQDFENRGVSIKNCPRIPNEAPFCSIIIAENGSRTILVSINNFPDYSYDDFRKVDLTPYTWIHFEARNFDEMFKMIQEVCTYNNKGNCANNQCERKLKMSLEIEMVREDFIPLAQYVDYVFLGREMATHMGWKTPYAAVHGLRELLKPQEVSGFRKPTIIAPWGSHGAAYLTPEDEYELVPPFPPPAIIDSVGAGDTFIAGVIYTLDVKKKSLRDAVEFGNRVAGFKIGYKGYDEIHKLLLADVTECTCPQYAVQT